MGIEKKDYVNSQRPFTSIGWCVDTVRLSQLWFRSTVVCARALAHSLARFSARFALSPDQKSSSNEFSVFCIDHTVSLSLSSRKIETMSSTIITIDTVQCKGFLSSVPFPLHLKWQVRKHDFAFLSLSGIKLRRKKQQSIVNTPRRYS